MIVVVFLKNQLDSLLPSLYLFILTLPIPAFFLSSPPRTVDHSIPRLPWHVTRVFP